MSTSPTHYCWPGCGCMEQAWRMDRGLSPFQHQQTIEPQPRLAEVQGLVCPCTMTWCGIGAPPRCYIHNPPYQEVWVGVTQPNWKAILEIQQLNQRHQLYQYEEMARFVGPALMGEFLKKLFYPLLDTE